MKFESLDRIATDIVLIDEYDGQYARVARVTARVLEHLNLHFVPFNIRSETFTIGQNLQIKLPGDWTDVTKVGTCQSNGEICVFGRNDRLCRIEEVDSLEALGCTCESEKKKEVSEEGEASTNAKMKDYTCSICTFHNHELGELYGYRESDFKNGTFRYFPKDNVISFGSGTDVYHGAQVVVEGVYADGSEKKLIPSDAFMMVRQFVLKMLNENGSLPAAGYHFEQFRHELSLYKNQYLPSLYDIIGAFRGNYSSSIKG